MEKKVVSLFTLPTSEEQSAQGIVESIFSVFGNIDSGNDIMHPGSFSRTFRERGKKVKVLDQHRTDSTMRILGVPLELRELNRNELPAQVLSDYPEATGGAYAKIQFLLNTPEGKGAFDRLKAGALDQWSFGYDAVEFERETISHNGKKIPVRHLRAVRLHELSPVIFAMNEATATVSAKENGDTEEKRVVPYQDIPLAKRTRAWSANAATRRVRDWAGYDADNLEAMDWAKYRKAFFWYDSENETVLAAYKLPYADIVGGELQAIPRAIFAVAAVLQGGRGGVDIPEADQERIRAVLSRWYGRMAEEFEDENIVAPWDKAEPVDMMVKGSFVPPAPVREAAALGLELRREHNRGGTQVGVARARDLSNGRAVSLNTIKRMRSYFARHAVDAEADGWEDREDPSAGWVAWLLWGGDAGKAWADEIVAGVESGDMDANASPPPEEEKSINLTAYCQEITQSFYHAYPDKYSQDGSMRLTFWVEEVWDEFVIVQQNGTEEGNGLWRVDYTIDQDGESAFADREDWVEGQRVFVPLPVTMQTSGDKAGRVLSQRNADKLITAIQTLQEVLIDAGFLTQPEDNAETDEGDGPSQTSSAPADRLAPADLLREIELELAHITYEK